MTAKYHSMSMYLRKPSGFTQKQMAELFDTTVQNVGQHIKLIYQDEELDQNRTIKNFFIVQIEGSRSVKREVEHYNLDMIISVGYKGKRSNKKN
jgi:hypothetical protein